MVKTQLSLFPNKQASRVAYSARSFPATVIPSISISYPFQALKVIIQRLNRGVEFRQMTLNFLLQLFVIDVFLRDNLRMIYDLCHVAFCLSQAKIQLMNGYFYVPHAGDLRLRLQVDNSVSHPLDDLIEGFGRLVRLFGDGLGVDEISQEFVQEVIARTG